LGQAISIESAWHIAVLHASDDEAINEGSQLLDYRKDRDTACLINRKKRGFAGDIATLDSVKNCIQNHRTK